MPADPRNRPEHIGAQRVLLRPIEPADRDAIYAYARRPEVARYVHWSAHRSLANTDQFIRTAVAEAETGTRSVFAIERHRQAVDPDTAARAGAGESSRTVGTITVTWEQHRAGEVSIGYVLHPEYWGQGLAAEAVEALVACLFEQPDIVTVKAYILPENIASIKLIERCGFVRNRPIDADELPDRACAGSYVWTRTRGC